MNERMNILAKFCGNETKRNHLIPLVDGSQLQHHMNQMHPIGAMSVAYSYDRRSWNQHHLKPA
jgi:hypothetical protein